MTGLASGYSHDWTRCENFAQAVEDLPADDDARVLDMVTEFGLTIEDFRALDEKPGWFSVVVNDKRVPYEQSEWARRLRVVRNDATNDLFDRLRRT